MAKMKKNVKMKKVLVAFTLMPHSKKLLDLQRAKTGKPVGVLIDELVAANFKEDNQNGTNKEVA